jgi:DNA polymerase-3 subunit gamma/tau
VSYLVLARKLRPQTFDEIVAQDHITETLKKAVQTGRIAHAYLFCGTRGTGKTSTARVLAKALNCVNGPTPEPCLKCVNCREIVSSSSMDVIEIDAASNTGVDSIRDLRENVRYAPAGSRYKIYIIDEVHRLSGAAFDALLKTLEEPPAHVVFMFATTEPHNLPATILSRAQRYDFRRIPLSRLTESLRDAAEKEGIKITDDALALIARKGDGSLRDALSLFEQVIAYADDGVTVDLISDALGFALRLYREYSCAGHEGASGADFETDRERGGYRTVPDRLSGASSQSADHHFSAGTNAVSRIVRSLHREVQFPEGLLLGE